MISDITLGQFFPGNSPLHRLDPRSKILLATLFIVSVFFANNPASFAFLVVATLLLIAISKISFKVVFKGVKPIVIIILITAVILAAVIGLIYLNFFRSPGSSVTVTVDGEVYLPFQERVKLWYR